MTSMASHEFLLEQVRAQIKKAYYDLESAELQLSATARAVSSAVENKRTAEERYKLGAGTVLDFITAESQYLTAQVNGVNAVYGYLGSRAAVEYLTAMTNR
jgi:outer membrane protein TolC